MKEKKLFTIFGNPVEHSRSPLMHNNLFKKLEYDACYTRTLLEDGSKLKESFLRLKLSGANITVPHKEEAFKACDEVRGFAKKIGVVNTIVNENGLLVGYNTDADGFLFAIRDFNKVQKILIIGAGGTAKALAMRFKIDGLDVSILNRSKERLAYFSENGFITYTWDEFPIKKYDLIINTTSAGLSDESYPAPVELLTSILQLSSYAADVIYGKFTPFLKLCQQLNIPYKDGAKMLLAQGVLANNYFTNSIFSLDDIQKHMGETFKY